MYENPIVFLVEDDPAVRKALGALLDTDAWELRCYGRPSELLGDIDTQTMGCLIVDLSLPEMSGLELCEKLRGEGISLPFVVISGQGQIPDAVTAMQLGAIDFMEKPVDSTALLARVTEAVARNRRQHSDESSYRDLHDRFQTLSQREREVFEQVAMGRSNKQMAQSLDLSEKTIEAHRSKMARKLNARTVAELVRLAIALEQH